MPIRFRCAYCNQLMGIARRKAGTVVKCPTCSGQVVVPASDASTAQAGTSAEHPAAPVLFERQDFDQLFGPATTDEPRKVKESSVPKKLAEPPAPSASGLAIDVDLVPAPAPPAPVVRQPGVHLSPVVALLGAVFVLILIAVAFLVGYFFGAAQ
jgi:phage FluMu protein Com